MTEKKCSSFNFIFPMSTPGLIKEVPELDAPEDSIDPV